MAFDIFVAGTNDFYYGRNGCETGKGLELIKIVAALQSVDVQSINHFNITGKGALIDIDAPGIADLMVSLAQREMVHNISNAVCLLAMNSNSSNGWISIDATEVNLLWANTIHLARYNFSPGDSPGAEFVQAIKTSLETTDLASFGVLLQISVALTKFQQHIDDSMTPMVNISLTH
jgi:hypothetical protein